MLNYLWAYLAGLLTLINPCVLPLLPIIIGTAFQSAKHGPLALACGLVVSFTLVGVGVTAFGHLIGLDAQIINRAAAVLMIVFGIVLLIPQSQAVITAMSAPLAEGANASIDRIKDAGLIGQFLIGGLLGAVWSPCIGPTLGGAVSLAASGENLLQATLTMLAFGFGVSTILLALAYGSRAVVGARKAHLMRMMPWAKTIMGVLLLLVGLAIFFHIDRVIEGWLLDVLPIWLQDLSISI
jgi:cytochrome c-type biogenesis protein